MGTPLEARIDNLKDVIRKTPVDILQENIYLCIANGCILLTAFKRQNGEKGWSSKLNNESGEPLFNSEQQKALEGAFERAPWLIDFLKEDLDLTSSKSQSGGSGGSGSGGFLPSLQISGNLIKGTTALSAEDVSLDLMLDSFVKKSNDIDEFWNKIAYQTPGFMKLINEHQDLHVMGVSIPIKPIVNLLMIILDSVRLSASLSGFASNKVMNVMGLIVLLEEMATGQWRQMLLTAASFLSPSGVAISVISKYFVNAWMLISPELRTQLFKDMLKGGKSALLGILLWAATSLPSEQI